MWSKSLAVALLLAGAGVVPLAAEVRLSIGRDGTKVIYNVPSASRPARSGPDFNWLARQRDRTSEFDAIIEHYARAHGVDPILVKAVIVVESNFDPSSVSSKGARGLMQLMPATARRFNVSSVHDPEENIRGGVAYLATLARLFPNDLSRVLAAYNAGENAVLRHGGIPPYEETKLYVRKALTVYHGRPYGSAVIIPGNRNGRLLQGGFMHSQDSSRPATIGASTIR